MIAGPIRLSSTQGDDNDTNPDLLELEKLVASEKRAADRRRRRPQDVDDNTGSPALHVDQPKTERGKT